MFRFVFLTPPSAEMPREGAGGAGARGARGIHFGMIAFRLVASGRPVGRVRAARVLALLLSVALSVGCNRDGRGDRRSDSAAARGTPAAAAAGCASGAVPAVNGEGVGSVRLGMPLGEAASDCPRRDTSWSSEGTTERGAVIVLAGHPVVARVATTPDSSITRLVVRDPALRVEGGLGVGSTVGQLRAAYGPLCALTGEGRIVAVVPSLPGLSFVTDAPLAASGKRLPDGARVTELLVHGVKTSCQAVP